MSDIPFTKDEFKTALEVQAKATEQMVLIASALKDITIELKEVHDRLSDGAIKDIVNGVCDNYNTVHKETINCMNTILKNQDKIMAFQEGVPIKVKEVVATSTIAKDIEHVKYLVAIVGIVVIVVSVIIKGLGFGNPDLKSETKVIEHMLSDHIKQTETIK